MAWRIDKDVVRGELDNRTRGKVTGAIWLAGRAEPVRLALDGNPWRDWAGCVLRFSNPVPEASGLDGFNSEQIGVCGDMTASRKVRIAPEPIREWLAQGAPGKDALPWGNSVYLEWFSDRNGRVVVESTRFEVEIGERAWRMTKEEEAAQRQRNLHAMDRFMERLEAVVGKAAETETAADGPNDANAPGETEDPESSRALRLTSEIEEMKRKSREMAGGEMIEGSSEQPVPLEAQHQFWQHVLAFESAPRRLRRDILAEDGFRAPPLEGLSEQDVTHWLWRLIAALAARRMYLSSTNHLSDRELYRLLIETVLEEETEAVPPEAEWNCRICIDEYGLAEREHEGPAQVYLRYYASEATRQRWAKDFGEKIPPHCDPPYDRDRHLPE